MRDATEEPRGTKRRVFTTEYKLAILEEIDRCVEPGAKSAVLRREGLYSSHVSQWRRARAVGALDPPYPAAASADLSIELERLRQRVERLEAGLAAARLAFSMQEGMRDLLDKLADDDPRDRDVDLREKSS